MTELKVELPVKINGVFFTRHMHSEICGLQSGNSFDDDMDKIYDNVGIAEVEADINEINTYFIDIIANADPGSPNARETRMLSLLHYIRYKINQFKVPEELLTPAK